MIPNGWYIFHVDHITDDRCVRGLDRWFNPDYLNIALRPFSTYESAQITHERSLMGIDGFIVVNQDELAAILAARRTRQALETP